MKKKMKRQIQYLFVFRVEPKKEEKKHLPKNKEHSSRREYFPTMYHEWAFRLAAAATTATIVALSGRPVRDH